MNRLDARAKLAERTVNFHAASLGMLQNDDDEEKLSDLLVDIFHLIADKGYEVEELLSNARRYATEEQMDPELIETEWENPNSVSDINIVSGRINGQDEDSVFLVEGDENLFEALGYPDTEVNCTFCEPLFLMLDEKR